MENSYISRTSGIKGRDKVGYAMGDVEDEVFNDFIDKLDHEIDYEN